MYIKLSKVSHVEKTWILCHINEHFRIAATPDKLILFSGRLQMVNSQCNVSLLTINITTDLFTYLGY